MQLRPRLNALLKMARLRPPAVLADVGTDHGKFPIAAVVAGAAPRAIGVDISAAALSSASRRLQAASVALGAAPAVELRVGDGVAPLRREDGVDMLCMAGIGAATQERILASHGCVAHSLGVSTLLLQLQDAPARIRYFLADSGWQLEAEDVVQDRGRFYVTMLASRAKHAMSGSASCAHVPQAARQAAALPPWSDAEAAIGPLLLAERREAALLADYVRHRRARVGHVLEGMQTGLNSRGQPPAGWAAKRQSLQQLSQQLDALLETL
eukprot:PLAT13902.1.p1 GENE.PLAT13902.1~~PLAT13902.1.p1  ORF type:complete len:268 (-),score=87.11 PLAT13902.1:114-917(-)